MTDTTEVVAPSLEDRAAVLFDRRTEAPPAVPAAAVSAEPALATGLYENRTGVAADAVAAVTAGFEIPEAVKQLRAGQIHDPALRYGSAISESDFVDGDEPAPVGVKTAVVHELRRMIADVGLSPVEGRELVTLAGQLTREPPSPEEEAAWVAESTATLLKRDGSPEDVQHDVDLARALVQRDPRLAKLLEVTRLGNHPRVIALCIEKARSEAARGRLVSPKRSL